MTLFEPSATTQSDALELETPIVDRLRQSNLTRRSVIYVLLVLQRYGVEDAYSRMFLTILLRKYFDLPPLPFESLLFGLPSERPPLSTFPETLSANTTLHYRMAGRVGPMSPSDARWALAAVT